MGVESTMSVNKMVALRRSVNGEMPPVTNRSTSSITGVA